jgi:hypothetical protein
MMSPTDTWLHDLAQDADRWWLMRMFGTWSKEGFENYLAGIKYQTRGTPAREELNKWEMALRPRRGPGCRRCGDERPQSPRWALVPPFQQKG